MREMSFKNKIKRLKQIQKHTSNWTDDKIVREAISSMEKLRRIKDLIEIYCIDMEDVRNHPNDYTDFEREVIGEVLLEDDSN